MKTIERSHLPSKLWERIKLSQNYTTALSQIDERLIYWPKFLLHKCKQRLTRLTQVAITSRRLAKEDERLGEKLVGVKPKVKRREATRERKALAAAKLERAIEKELVERLRSGAYGDKPLNVEEGIWKKVLRGLEKEGAAERDMDYDEDEDEEEEEEEELEDEEDVGEVEYVSGDEELEEEELGDLEDWLEGSGASDFDENDDGSDSDDDSDDSEEEEDPKKKKGKLPLKKAPIDDKKRKRGQAPQNPRKRGFFLYLFYTLPSVLTVDRWRTCRGRIRGRKYPSQSPRIGVLILGVSVLPSSAGEMFVCQDYETHEILCSYFSSTVN